MSNNIIPIIRHAPSRAVLRESFSEINHQIVHLVARIQGAVMDNDDHFFGLCDELRCQINELVAPRHLEWVRRYDCSMVGAVS